MTEAEKRLHRCCFTGHRPEKLHQSERVIIKQLQSEIKEAVGKGHTTFITGMAKGVDIWAAEIVINLSRKDPRIKLICALPYPDFGQHWRDGWSERFNEIMSQADFVKVVCKEFSYSSYQLRNKWLVDHSSYLIAVFNGESGGTKNTLDYARTFSDLKIAIIDNC